MGLSPDMVTFCMGMAKEILEGDSDIADGLRAILIPLYFVNRSVLLGLVGGASKNGAVAWTSAKEEKKAVAEKRKVKKPLLKLVATRIADVVIDRDPGRPARTDD